MNKSYKRSLDLFYPAMIGTSLIIIALIFVAAFTQIHNNSLLTGYIAEKTLGNILGSVNRGDNDKLFNSLSDVISFGIYNEDCMGIVTYGKAPPCIEKPEPEQERLYDYEMFNDYIRILRNVMPPPMMRRPFRGGGHNMMPMMQKPERYVLLEIKKSRLIPNNNIYIVTVIVLPAAVVLLTGLIIGLYRKNKQIALKYKKQEELARLGEVSRTISHEIKNPLGIIKLQTNLIKKLYLKDEYHELSVIDNEVERIRLITERIGDFVRDPVGTRENVDISGAIDTFSRSINIPLKINELHGSARFINIDRQRLRSILENVIFNAYESNVEAGSPPDVSVEISNDKNYVTIEVKDNGKGFKDLSERVFDPYYTTKTKGSGIGLAIVKRFVSAVNGKIYISNNDVGASVRISFERSAT